MMISDRYQKIIAESLAIEADSAKDADAVGFMARSLAQATMPHRPTEGVEFCRRNGSFEMSMFAPRSIGLPYGSIPRLLVSWVTREAVRTQDRTLFFGRSLSAFMREIGLDNPTGGRGGSIPRLRMQMGRLFASHVTAVYRESGHLSTHHWNIVDSADLWWCPLSEQDASMWFTASITLGQAFFEEVTQAPIPVDMRALKVLKQSPMALDIYTWLTYRMSYLRQPTVIPWCALQEQFGADYVRPRAFKAAFLKHAKAVQVVYPKADIEPIERGLKLRPSRPHVAKSRRARA